MENEINGEIKQESVIENKYNVTKKMYLEWTKENKRNLYFKIFWIIILIYSIIMSIVNIVYYSTFNSIYFIFAIYALYRGVFRQRMLAINQYNVLTKLYKKSDWERKIIFFNDYIETCDENTNRVKFQYSDIVDVNKNNKYIKIEMASGGCLRIYRDAFTKSNFGECEEFLNNKRANQNAELEDKEVDKDNIRK